MGDEQLEQAYAQGMALSLEKALDLALSRERGCATATMPLRAPPWTMPCSMAPAGMAARSAKPMP